MKKIFLTTDPQVISSYPRMQEHSSQEITKASIQIIENACNNLYEVAINKQSPHLKFVTHTIEKAITSKTPEEFYDYLRPVGSSEYKKTMGMESKVTFSPEERQSLLNDNLSKIWNAANKIATVLKKELEAADTRNRFIAVKDLVSYLQSMNINEFHKQKEDLFAYLTMLIAAENKNSSLVLQEAY